MKYGMLGQQRDQDTLTYNNDQGQTYGRRYRRTFVRESEFGPAMAL